MIIFNKSYSNAKQAVFPILISDYLDVRMQSSVKNLESIQGALLRMNRSIQAEGTFGIMKNDRWYKRIVRRGMEVHGSRKRYVYSFDLPPHMTINIL